ncbi:MAG: S41 family peptidase [Bacillota bacterium]
MRKIKKLLLGITMVLAVLSFVFAFFYTALRYTPILGTKPPEFYSYPDYTQILTPQEMKEDLRQLKADLEQVHPATIYGLPADMEAAFAEAENKANQEMTVGEFAFLAAELTCMLGDAHTGVMLGFGERLLPMEIKILDGKIFVLGGRNLYPGDQLLSLGGVTADEILAQAERVLPAENPYWLKDYIRNMLTESVLTQMGAEIDYMRGLDAEVLRNGETQVIRLEFGFTYEKADPYPERQFYPSNDSYQGYYLDQENSLCHFRLQSCIYDEEYVDFVRTMFQDIKNQGIENIIVDLRGNYGGNTYVAQEFLKYIDIDEYKYFGSVRRMSRAASEQRGYLARKGTVTWEPETVTNQKAEELLFAGNIYTLIDNGTFSAAKDFAVILADNGIGTIIGEPSGNAPNSYGDILSFQLQHSKLFYNISYTQWMRPDEGLADADALYPHYQVTYTIDDYINNRDLAMEEALKLIQGDYCLHPLPYLQLQFPY